MASVKATMRHALLSYPGIAPCPMAVAIQWFSTNGNGMDWNKKGELSNWDGLDVNVKMEYDDLDERNERCEDKDNPESYMHSLHNGFFMEAEAERALRQFVETNIDRLCDAPVTTKLFAYSVKGRYYYIEGVSLEYAHAFNFPDNIAPDWAEALRQFHDNWLVDLNCTYGPPKGKGNVYDVSYWPEHAQKLRAAIIDAQKRLYPLMHNGEAYEVGMARRAEMAEKIIEALLKEDK